MPRSCSHPDGCPRPHKAHGWCKAHWERIRATGKPGPAQIKILLPMERECCVGGCTDSVGHKSARGMCNKHYLRWRTHRDPHVVRNGGASLSGPTNPRWSGSDATYNTVHQRLRRERGQSSDHPCVDCRCQAAHWSYSYSGVPEYIDPQFGRYSPDLSTYEPRCVSCHRKFDNAVRRALLTGTRPEEAAINEDD